MIRRTFIFLFEVSNFSRWSTTARLPLDREEAATNGFEIHENGGISISPSLPSIFHQWILRFSLLPRLPSPNSATSFFSPSLGIGLSPFPMDAPEYQKPSVRKSKKRDAEEQSLQLATANKRAVLGDITNSLIFRSSQCSVSDQDMAEEKQGLELPQGRAVDSKKSASSASSLYNHLRSMEVRIYAPAPWF